MKLQGLVLDWGKWRLAPGVLVSLRQELSTSDSLLNNTSRSFRVTNPCQTLILECDAVCRNSDVAPSVQSSSRAWRHFSPSGHLRYFSD